MPRSLLFGVFAAAALAGCTSGDPAPPPPPPPPAAAPLWGFVPFPYDATAAAQDALHDIILPNSELYALHLDLAGCIPWSQAMSGAPFPAWFEAGFDDALARVTPRHRIYVSTTPTDQSRVDMVGQCGDAEGAPAPMPPALAGKDYDDPAIIDAYAAYADRVIAKMNPSFFLVGIEITGLSLNAPARWPAFERFYFAVYDRLKARHPALPIGVEMEAQGLMLKRVGDQVKPTVDKADFLGVSFYPYSSEFGEFFGLAPLPPPPAQWRTPLAFLKTYTDKPIAIAETGYTTRDVTLPNTGLHFPGDEFLQEQFLRDLVATAHKDRYLFIVWFVPVDYPALLEKIGIADEAVHIWEFAGLHDRNLVPKRAWGVWLNRNTPP